MSTAKPPLVYVDGVAFVAPGPQHLGLGAGETHAGFFEDCTACAEYLRAHPGTPVPAKRTPRQKGGAS